MCDLYIIAEILRPHGNRGEVALRPLTDHLPTLTGATRVFLGQRPDRPVRVISVRMHKGAPLMLLEGISSIGEAERLKGQMLCLPKEELLPLEEGEFFLHDLAGLTLLDYRGREVGKVDRILETAGPPLLAGIKTNGEPFMVPFTHGIIEEVDIEKSTITIVDLPGLVNDRDRV
jgi:16S rRNA processing protein RimM